MAPTIDTRPTQRPDNPVVRKLGPKRIDLVLRYSTLRLHRRGTKDRGSDHPHNTCPGDDATSCFPPHIRPHFQNRFQLKNSFSRASLSRNTLLVWSSTVIARASRV